MREKNNMEDNIITTLVRDIYRYQFAVEVRVRLENEEMDRMENRTPSERKSQALVELFFARKTSLGHRATDCFSVGMNKTMRKVRRDSGSVTFDFRLIGNACVVGIGGVLETFANKMSNVFARDRCGHVFGKNAFE